VSPRPRIVPASGRSDGRKVVEVLLFENEDDLRRGDATMSAIAPGEGSMHRVALELLEVPVHIP